MMTSSATEDDVVIADCSSLYMMCLLSEVVPLVFLKHHRHTGSQALLSLKSWILFTLALFDGVDLQSFMDNSKNGVIYFSLGSNMKSILLPEEKRVAILKVFSKLPYDILWKWEESAMSGKPDNVRLGKWFSQNDILAHPNTKLFISHGGLLSMIEALHHGVPVLGIPIFGDQGSNVATATRNGYALQLELADLTDETFANTIKEIMHNPRYKANAVKRSSLLRDQLVSPMDQAVFWVEHVIRHKGAPHLKNAGVKLYWYQYILLDVAVFILFLVLLVLFVFYFSIKITFSLICGKREQTRKSDKKTK